MAAEATRIENGKRYLRDYEIKIIARPQVYPSRGFSTKSDLES